MTKTIGNVARSGECENTSVGIVLISEAGTDRVDCRNAADKRRFNPRERMIELKRCKHVMKTGIFWGEGNVSG